MKQGIAEKIKKLHDIKMQTQIYKVIPTLLFISSEDLQENIDSLLTIGISIRHIYEVKICALKPGELKRRIAYILEKGNATKFIKNPLLILDSREFSKELPNIEIPIPEPTKEYNAISDTDLSKIINSGETFDYASLVDDKEDELPVSEVDLTSGTEVNNELFN